LLLKKLKFRIYKINFTCGFLWVSLTLRVEHRLRVIKNRVLRRTFGPKKDEVTRGWRKLHNEENYQIEEVDFGGHVARMGETRIACKLLVGKPEGKRILERRRRTWVGTIKMDRMWWCGSG
jgi:hypothetical protein